MPLESGYKVNDLMQEKANEPHRESYESHHHPAVPFQSGRLAFDPVFVHHAVGGQVIQAVICGQGNSLFCGVLVVDIAALKVSTLIIEEVL